MSTGQASTRSVRAAIATTIGVLALVVAACGGTTVEPAADGGSPIALGSQLYRTSCATCHGGDAQGIDGLGKGLVASAVIENMSDEELAAFILEGRPADHPDNSTGVQMPPKGGNPSLTDDDVDAIVAYLRTLNG